jgi:hypothetical protein
MSVHVTETTVDPPGRVVLDHLPFRPGEKVDVVLRSHDEAARSSVDLRGSVLRYERPFDPVADEDREA